MTRWPRGTRLSLASSKVGDRWGNSRATAAVLAALAAYAEKYEAPAGAKVDATVTLAGKERLHQSLPVPGSATVDLPMAQVDNGDLVLAAAGGPLYYDARLSYAPLQPVAAGRGLHPDPDDGAGRRDRARSPPGPSSGSR